VVTWVTDWAVFRVRSARGTAFDSVQVEEYLSTALKGNKQEFDYMGTAQVSCARRSSRTLALLPAGGCAGIPRSGSEHRQSRRVQVRRPYFFSSWYSCSVLISHRAALSIWPATIWSTAVIAVSIE